jgi:hypothetical protein
LRAFESAMARLRLFTTLSAIRVGILPVDFSLQSGRGGPRGR